MPCIAFKPSNLLEVHIANMKEEIAILYSLYLYYMYLRAVEI